MTGTTPKGMGDIKELPEAPKTGEVRYSYTLRMGNSTYGIREAKGFFDIDDTKEKDDVAQSLLCIKSTPLLEGCSCCNPICRSQAVGFYTKMTTTNSITVLAVCRSSTCLEVLAKSQQE
jgi:hypothetical protein